jgi:hypothetical protein
MINADEYEVKALLPPAARTATANGSSVDVKDYVGGGKVVLHSAAGGGTSPTMDVKLQDSADDSTFADVSGKVFTQVVGAASLQSMEVDLDSLRRYIRLVVTIGGTSPTFTCDAALLAKKDNQ